MAIRLLYNIFTDSGPGLFNQRFASFDTDTKEVEEVNQQVLTRDQDFVLEANSLLHDECSPAGGVRNTYYFISPDANPKIRIQETPDASCPIAPNDCNLRIIASGSQQVSGTTGNTIFVEASSTAGPITFILTGRSPITKGAPDANGLTTTRAEFTNVPAGNYTVFVQDTAGCRITTAPIGAGTNVQRGPWISYNKIVRDDFIFFGDDFLLGYIWNRITKQVEFFNGAATAQDPLTFQAPIGSIVDEYFLSDGKTYRKVLVVSADQVQFEDSFIETPPTTNPVGGAVLDLIIRNVIQTDLDSEELENGAIWVEAESPAAFISYRYIHADGTEKGNRTGQINGLKAGKWRIEVADSDGRLRFLDVELTALYQPRWLLDADDLKSEPLQLTIFEAGWKGQVTKVCGTGNPITRAWENSAANSADNLPQTVSSSLTISLITQVERQFEDTVTGGDRKHRVDVRRRNGELVFRGYIVPDLYDEALLGAGQEVTLTASDGLGGLSETYYTNHLGDQMLGRRPLLSTILHCLSRTDINLPLYTGINLRDELMSPLSDPLLASWARRDAYSEEDKRTDCLTVLNAILVTFNAQIFQRNGAWWVIALNEVDGNYAIRGWDSIGLPLPAAPLPQPYHILPPKDATAEQDLYWVDAGQRVGIIAAAKATQATVKLQYVQNQLANGDFQLWDSLNQGPLNWLVFGDLNPVKVQADKGKFAIQMRASFPNPTGNALTSSPVPHLDGLNETITRLRLQYTVDGNIEEEGAPKLDNVMSLRVDVLVGVTVVKTINFTLSSADGKNSKQELYLPTGLVGPSLQIRLYQPVVTAGNILSTLTLHEVALEIQPAAVDWPDTDSSLVALNSDGIVIQPPVELVHADFPRLVTSRGTLAPVTGMDVYAWKHALSLADGRATTTWSRPTDVKVPATLLDTAAIDRLDLRTFNLEILTGEVQGKNISQLGVGHMLDVVFDADGKYLVVACTHDERRASAQITLRKMREGNYSLDVIPDNVRLANDSFRRTKRGYRVANK